MNIFVVDDEKNQLTSLRIGLVSNGHKVQTALSAAEAIETLKDNNKIFDLLITDYVMPGMDGIMLLKKVREVHHHLPVIMMTAYGEKDLVLDALHNRCDGFIEKPFSLEQLIEEVERVRVNTMGNIHSQQLRKYISQLIQQINDSLMIINAHMELCLYKFDEPELIKKSIESVTKASMKIQNINKQMLNSHLDKESSRY